LATATANELNRRPDAISSQEVQYLAINRIESKRKAKQAVVGVGVRLRKRPPGERHGKRPLAGGRTAKAKK
jgi:hypothetical protein